MHSVLQSTALSTAFTAFLKINPHPRTCLLAFRERGRGQGKRGGWGGGGGRETERQRERHQSVASQMHPNWGSNLQTGMCPYQNQTHNLVVYGMTLQTTELLFFLFLNQV